LRRIFATLSISTALACAPSQRSVSSMSPEAAAEAQHARDGLFRPDKIFAILESSSRHYEIASVDDVEPKEIPEVVPEQNGQARPIDPYLEVKLDDAERIKLVSSRPPPEIAEIFEHASNAAAARDYHTAQALYAKAIEVAPDYFKTYTYIGNAYYFLGEYQLAESAFAKAIKLNPVDYQAYLFLGDTYYQMEEFARSKEILTKAYMLNRTNDVVQERLRAALAKIDLRIRTNRLAPRIQIDRQGENVVLKFDKASGLRWLALSACLACWAFESECGDRADEDEDPLRLSMYRECLINQAASIAVRMGRDDEEIGADERVLLGAIEDGFLEAIIFWEIVASRAPVVILLLPDEVKVQILEYIDRYVFESTRLI
jgi:tetratricopeptide (TPR) repeat protein